MIERELSGGGRESSFLASLGLTSGKFEWQAQLRSW
jgi:hypothetical protein